MFILNFLLAPFLVKDKEMQLFVLFSDFLLLQYINILFLYFFLIISKC